MRGRLLVGVLLSLCAAGASAEEAGRDPVREVRIAGGTFRPLYAQPGETTLTVAPFLLDADPVTRAEYEAFVRAEPRWQKGSAPALFVDAGYLRDWTGPADAGALDRDHPVTDVSWFAARAYCRSLGRRLPTTAEWEYAALADETDARAAQSPEFRQRALELALKRRLHPVGLGFQNAWGVRGLHGGVMEWVSDFQSIFAGSDSRATSRQERELTCAGGATTNGDAGDYAAFLRYAFRASVEGRTTTGTMGFRCARSIR